MKKDSKVGGYQQETNPQQYKEKKGREKKNQWK